MDSKPFLCIITPAFIPALPALQGLIKDLQRQTFTDFIQITITNGPEIPIQDMVTSLNDARFIYDIFVSEPENVRNLPNLMANIGKRRNWCLKKYNAERYVFLDADLEILNKNYFQELFDHHSSADILLTYIEHLSSTLPIYPFNLGQIDMANFSFSQKIAKNYDYPTDYSPTIGKANDWRFYGKIKHHSHKLLSIVSSKKDGRNYYTRLSTLK